MIVIPSVARFYCCHYVGHYFQFLHKMNNSGDDIYYFCIIQNACEWTCIQIKIAQVQQGLLLFRSVANNVAVFFLSVAWVASAVIMHILLSFYVNSCEVLLPNWWTMRCTIYIVSNIFSLAHHSMPFCECTKNRMHILCHRASEFEQHNATC